MLFYFCFFFLPFFPFFLLPFFFFFFNLLLLLITITKPLPPRPPLQCPCERRHLAGAMEGSTGFGIDSILSHRAGSPAVPKGDPLVGDGRSPLELSPRSEGSSGCPSPRSPGRECLEAAVPRPGLDAHLQPGQVSAPSQSRTVTSSFLIRDILADCKPLAACAPYSSTNGPHGGQEPAGRIPTKPGEDFREKMEKNTSSSSSDSEYKGKRRSPPLDFARRAGRPGPKVPGGPEAPPVRRRLAAEPALAPP